MCVFVNVWCRCRREIKSLAAIVEVVVSVSINSGVAVQQWDDCARRKQQWKQPGAKTSAVSDSWAASLFRFGLYQLWILLSLHYAMNQRFA